MFKEVVRDAGLSSFAEIGLIFFVVAFAMILILAFFGMSERARDEVSRLPLADGLDPVTPDSLTPSAHDHG